VVEDHEPVVISRQKAESVVMESLADWHAIEETLAFDTHQRPAPRLLIVSLGRLSAQAVHQPANFYAPQDLIKECTRTPLTGTGKPEALRGDLKGWWSRRVTLEDRLVSRVSGTGRAQQLAIAQCRWHN
jgi:Txe/YoeB family toxin of toxin-antitoxin system